MLGADGYPRGFGELLEHVVETTGLAYYRSRPESLLERVEARMEHTGTSSLAAYLTRLRGETPELDELAGELIVGETYFFRHTEQFRSLRDTILPEILRRTHSSKHVRIWSAGCSNGAEAYSLSILLRRELGLQSADHEISIVGTDLCTTLLAQAERAGFRDWSFREQDWDPRPGCFDQRGEQWFLRERYRRAVHFRHHNLVRDGLPSLAHGLTAFDLILCRNVLIYFDHEVARRTVERLASCLVPGGWLILGHADSQAGWFENFEQVQIGSSVYYRRPTATSTGSWPSEIATGPPRPSPATPPAGGPEPRAALPRPEPSPHDALARVADLADRGLIAEALKTCEAAVAAHGEDSQLLLRHALLLQELGQLERASRALEQMLQLDGGSPLAHYFNGLLLHRTGRPQEAREALERASQECERIPPGSLLDAYEGMTAADIRRLARAHLLSLSAT